MSDEFACSHCGAMLPADANFCRHCGASDEYGWDRDDPWSETRSDEDEAGYAEDDFDYDDFVAREFPDQTAPDAPTIRKQNGILWLMVLVCVGIVLSAIVAAMSGQF